MMSLVQFAKALTITLDDNTMSNGNWSSFFGSTGNKTQAAGHIDSSDIGSHGYLATIVEGYFPPTTYQAFHFFIGGAYIPSLYGAIDHVDFDIWNRIDFGGHYWNFAFYQGGRIFVSDQLEDSREPSEPGASGWHHTTGRSAKLSSFYKLTGSGPSTLQFGVNADPIFLGFMNGNNVGLRDSQFHLTTVGEFDATLYHATITTVPEPTSAGVIAAGVGVFGLARRRKR